MMNRRKSLGLTVDGIAAGLISAAAGTSAAAGESQKAQLHKGADRSPPQTGKATIVMIHGGWHWGGCFQKVATRLAANGHPVILPDLTAHGYSPATYDQITSIADHVAPVAEILEAASEPVILLGHSLGGVALTYLGERYPEKVRKLIYLTAFMAPDGKTVSDYVYSSDYAKDPAASEIVQLLSASADGKGVVLGTDDPVLLKAAFYADCSARDIAVAAANITPVISGVQYVTPSTITPEKFGSIPRVFIECTADRAIPIAIQRKMQADVPGATVMTMPTSHSPFFSAPERLADLILAASA